MLSRTASFPWSFLGTDLIPDDLVVESFEDCFEVALLELLVNLSIHGHIGMLCHILLSEPSEGTPAAGRLTPAGPSGDLIAPSCDQCVVTADGEVTYRQRGASWTNRPQDPRAPRSCSTGLGAVFVPPKPGD
jgi:hypothetical protein